MKTESVHFAKIENTLSELKATVLTGTLKSFTTWICFVRNVEVAEQVIFM